MFGKNLQNLNQKLRLASRNILGEKAGGPVDSTFDRAKAQWLSLEQSVRLLLTEANNYKVEMKGIGDNGAQMMNKIAGMFQQDTQLPAANTSPTAGAPGGAPTAEASNDWPDPNENHPYKDVVELMRQTQAKIQQEDIAVSTVTPPPLPIPPERASAQLPTPQMFTCCVPLSAVLAVR